jgi:hypothetical protein
MAHPKYLREKARELRIRKKLSLQAWIDRTQDRWLDSILPGV